MSTSNFGLIWLMQALSRLLGAYMVEVQGGWATADYIVYRMRMQSSWTKRLNIVRRILAHAAEL